MRFMVIVKADQKSESGAMPDERLLVAMGKFNQEMDKAGVMLAGEGLQPSSKGARIRFAGDKRIVLDGPFAQTRELAAGYWLIRADSLADAIGWIKRAPFEEGEVEIRQVFEEADFAPQVKSEAGKKMLAEQSALRARQGKA